MNFLAPAAFAFAAAIPVVILFYLLKRKRVAHRVSSTLLWQRFLAETQASAPFQRLRHNWLLVLQLLLLVLTLLALARPYFAGATRPGRLLVVILDASASMQSRDEEPSRFERARRAALALVDSLQDTDQMVVLQAAAQTEVKQSPTSNKAALRRALEDCAVTDSPTRLLEAFKLAQPLVRDRRDAEIHLFSDGALGPLEEFEFEGLNVVFHRFGQTANNRGVVSVDVRPLPEDPARRAVFAGVFNAASNAAPARVDLLLDDRLLESRWLNLGPRETQPVLFSAVQERDGIFTVRLAEADDLLADNAVSVVSRLPRPVKVLLVTCGNRFLERALVAAPNTEVAVAADCSDPARDFDLVVLDNVLPAVWPEAHVLAIRAAQAHWLEVTGRVEAPLIVDWRSTHPLLRFVSLDNVAVAESLAVKTPDWAVPLVESAATPLILAGEVEGRRLVWLGFDTLQSTWPLRVSFPIFIANAVEWLNPAATRDPRMLVRAGDPLRLPLREPAREARVRLPDGTERVLALDSAAREVVFGETARCGVYRLAVGTNEVAFAVNLLDAAESDTTPQPEIQLGRYARAAAATLRPANLEWWRWFAAAGLAVLLFEWWYYHKRTA